MDGQKFELDELGFQAVLERAYRGHNRPMCLCSAAPIPVYITCLGGTFVLKRMPCTGCHHAVDCSHYEPPDELSGSTKVGSAIADDPNTGLTELNVDFSLSCGPSRSTSHGIASAVSSVHALRPSLSLRGLLQFLWDEAELTRWRPGFAGKRTWAVVRHHLLRAAANKVLKGQLLANVIFIPESFSLAHKEQIAARRSVRLEDGLMRPGQRHRKMIVIGEVKEIVPARNAFSIVLKHLPDLSFSIDAGIHRQMIRKFEGELSLWVSTADVHLIIAATFTLATWGQPIICEMSLVSASSQWIPAEDAFELRQVNALVHEGRSFRKSLCLNAGVPSRSPNAMLLDVEAAPLGLALDRDSKHRMEASTVAESGSTPEWLWRIREVRLPAFPR